MADSLKDKASANLLAEEKAVISADHAEDVESKNTER